MTSFTQNSTPMLRDITVRNFAIIDELKVGFTPGLNILSGETGAGKSIIIGALGIALGGRAYTEMVKTGAGEAVVEAFFDVRENPVLDSLGIPSTDGVLIRRTVSAAGRSRAYVNDTMVTVQSLNDLGRTLVDVHGQHEHQSLLSSESQMAILDTFGGLGPQVVEFSALYGEVTALKKKIADMRIGARERAQRIDLLKFQVEEIETASLETGEEIKLEEERGILSNLVRLTELVEVSYDAVYGGEGSGLDKLNRTTDSLREMAEIDGGVSEVLELLEQAVPLVEDASHMLRGFKDRYDLDPARLEAVDDRLELIRALKKKYGDSVEDILLFHDEAQAELDNISAADETAEELEKELAGLEASLSSTAGKLTSGRKKAAKSIESSVKSVLKGLALEKADFEVVVRETGISSTGADVIEFLFSANPGEAAKPLSKVASGGELSRIMLAIKSTLREADAVPVLIFDEVDAGIGGKTAVNVATKLRELAKGRQVLCITHLAQIASLADVHFHITKGEKQGRVYVTVDELKGTGREEEIARMLSGSVTDTSLEHAREILGKTA
jgi:DNA repair protein RecN (Recombination protein N)